MNALIQFGLMLGLWAGAVILAVLLVLGIIRVFLGYWP